jgi:hypothetical protein
MYGWKSPNPTPIVTKRRLQAIELLSSGSASTREVTDALHGSNAPAAKLADIYRCLCVMRQLGLVTSMGGRADGARIGSPAWNVYWKITPQALSFSRDKQ